MISTLKRMSKTTPRAYLRAENLNTEEARDYYDEP